MSQHDPETGLWFDDTPWRPREQHTRFRVALTACAMPTVPPNALAVEPSGGYPVGAKWERFPGSAAGSAYQQTPQPPLFVILPWTTTDLVEASDFWVTTKKWLGDDGIASVLKQIELGFAELARRENLPHPQSVPWVGEP